MVASADTYAEFSSLLIAGLGGNQAAYAQFLQRITPMLRRIAARKLPPNDVDDVVQEILISVHKARHTYDGKRPVMPWLLAIARFRMTDHLRKHYAQMRHKTVDIQELEEFLPDVTQTGSENESIEELLAGVPENHKRILTMMHVEGYTAKEVGKQVNMKESAVKVAAHRAIKKIRDKFGT